MTPPAPEDATRQVAARARELGFDWFGVARAEPLRDEEARLRAWLAEGRHGLMEWLGRDPGRRSDPALVLPGCRSVLVVGVNYQTAGPDQGPSPGTGRVSRYARGTDYHRALDKPLKKLARFTNALGGEGAHSKPYVDHGPVMERAWAARAGLGFIGKHTLLIHPQQGSWHFLGVVLTTLEMEPTAPAAEGGCGDCTRCVDACPTGAITEPWQLDARLCLSYLTIEHPGPVEVPLWPSFEGNVFGCDICQNVCPYNIKRASPAPVDRFAPAVVPGDAPLSDWLVMGAAEFDQRFARSPIRRTGRDGMARNALIVASERGGAELLPAMQSIADDPCREEWLRSVARRAILRLTERLAGRSTDDHR